MRVTATQSVCDQTVTRPLLPAETAPSWIVVAIILTASVCVACLLLLGCFALMWCIYKKTKYAFAHGNKLPQHLKEVSGGARPAAGRKSGLEAVVPSQGRLVQTSMFSWNDPCLASPSVPWCHFRDVCGHRRALTEEVEVRSRSSPSNLDTVPSPTFLL